MAMTIDVKAVGLDEMNKTLKRIFGYATSVEGVEVTSSQRTSHFVQTSDQAFSGEGAGRDVGGSATNATVLQGLANQGRDFAAPDDALNKEIAAAFTQELQRQINRKNQNVDSAAASIYRRAMKTYRKTVVKRILGGSAPGGVAPLTADYKRWKLQAFGKADPIGVATGQLIRELETDGKIKLIKAAGVSGLKLPSIPKT